MMPGRRQRAAAVAVLVADRLLLPRPVGRLRRGIRCSMAGLVKAASAAGLVQEEADLVRVRTVAMRTVAWVRQAGIRGHWARAVFFAFTVPRTFPHSANFKA